MDTPDDRAREQSAQSSDDRLSRLREKATALRLEIEAGLTQIKEALASADEALENMQDGPDSSKP